MSRANLKRNLWALPVSCLVCLVVLLLSPHAQKRVHAQFLQQLPNVNSAPQGQSGPAIFRAGANAAAQAADYWTPERMGTATPMELKVDRVGISTPGVVRQLPADARPMLTPAYDPTAGASNVQAMTTLPVMPMTSPPFSPPGTPTDFINYSPFQRWTHFGNYFTFPISTIGKLFFNQNGGSFVCSASVINMNTIATAGHCVHDGSGSPTGFSSNFVFCPSYTPGGCIRGQWFGVTAVTSTQWFNGGLPDRDYACVVMSPTVTSPPGLGQLGATTGFTGRASNFPSRQAELAFGYPAASPFPGFHIINASSTEWYEVDFGSDGAGFNNQVSKYIGNDMTGGSSGGPWWLGYRHPNAAFEYPDTDGSNITDPQQSVASGGPYINGVNSHKRCNAGGCPAGSIFTQEMGSPQFMNTVADTQESEDIFQACFAAGGN